MELKSLIQNNRSYRRYDGDYTIDRQTLVDLVDLTRYTSSARNAQPLRYYVSADRKRNDEIFPSLAWAGYLQDWAGPSESERPTAYIVMLTDTTLISHFTPFDAGLASQSILLGAVEKGLGGCIIGAVKKEMLRQTLHIEDPFEILCVIALGKPMETVVLDEMQGDDFKYWRDEQGVHHVPKRKLEDIIMDV